MRRSIGRYSDINQMDTWQIRELLADLIEHLGLDVYEEVVEDGYTRGELRHVSYEFEKS